MRIRNFRFIFVYKKLRKQLKIKDMKEYTLIRKGFVKTQLTKLMLASKESNIKQSYKGIDIVNNKFKFEKICKN